MEMEKDLTYKIILLSDEKQSFDVYIFNQKVNFIEIVSIIDKYKIEHFGEWTYDDIYKLIEKEYEGKISSIYSFDYGANSIVDLDEWKKIEENKTYQLIFKFVNEHESQCLNHIINDLNNTIGKELNWSEKMLLQTDNEIAKEILNQLDENEKCHASEKLEEYFNKVKEEEEESI